MYVTINTTIAISGGRPHSTTGAQFEVIVICMRQTGEDRALLILHNG